MLTTTVTKRIRNVLQELNLKEMPQFRVEMAPEGFGELATNAAFLASKELRKPPREVADIIVEKLSGDPLFEKCETAGPGFVNFWISWKVYTDVVMKIIEEGEGYGRQPPKKERIQFEFASVNPTGPITVGHGRQAVIGDVLARIFEWNGYDVQREMYINDAGRQIDLLAYSLWVRYNELLGAEGLEIPEDGYKGEYLVDLARKLVEEVKYAYKERWDDETRAFFRHYALGSMLSSMKATLRSIGIEFDEYFSESSLIEDGTVKEVLDLLEEKGYTYEKDGAVWFRVSSLIDEDDKVLVRSDGSPTYFLTDIAYHLNKCRRGFSRVYDIWGSDHHGHEPRMRAAMKALGIPDSFFNVIFHQYVTLKRSGEVVKMSTRRGEFVTLDELVEAVGVDAVRYFFSMIDANTHLNFDMDLALKKSEENPVYYVQYSHARIRSIFKKASEKGFSFMPGKGLESLGNEKERALVLQLSVFPKVLEDAARVFATNKLTGYLENLASKFHSFYTDNLVLDPENPEVSHGRLNLCKAAEIVMKNALGILGVSAPERM